MIKSIVDLKGISEELSEDIRVNYDWLNREISYVIDGSYDSDKLNKEIIELYDITKENRGKRGSNLIAKIGLFYIVTYHRVNLNQAISIYNYLSNEDKLIYRDIVISNLDYYIENL